MQELTQPLDKLFVRNATLVLIQWVELAVAVCALVVPSVLRVQGSARRVLEVRLVGQELGLVVHVRQERKVQ